MTANEKKPFMAQAAKAGLIRFMWAWGRSIDCAGVIGEGAFGVVREAVDPCTGERFPVKMAQAGFEGDPYEDLCNELHFLTMVSHPSIVKCFGLVVQESNVQASNTWALLFELAECDLSTWLAWPANAIHSAVVNPMQPGKAWFNPMVKQRHRMWLQLCNALRHMHSKDVLHADVKPQNVLVTASGFLKLADLGCCVQLRWLGERSGAKEYSAKGYTMYTATCRPIECIVAADNQAGGT